MIHTKKIDTQNKIADILNTLISKKEYKVRTINTYERIRRRPRGKWTIHGGTFLKNKDNTKKNNKKLNNDIIENNNDFKPEVQEINAPNNDNG